MVDWRRLGPALHRGRGTDRGGEDQPGASARRAPRRAARPRGGGGQSLPGALLPGPERLGLPDPALLPPESLATAAEAAPDGPLRLRDGERLRVREGPDLRDAHPAAGGAGPLRPGLRRARPPGAAAGSRHLPPVPSRGAAPAHQAPGARLRAPLRRRLSGGALPDLRRLLLPLL